MAGSADYCAAGFRDERVEGAGHWLQWEQPDAVNELLLDFLAGSSEPRISRGGRTRARRRDRFRRSHGPRRRRSAPRPPGRVRCAPRRAGPGRQRSGPGLVAIADDRNSSFVSAYGVASRASGPTDSAGPRRDGRPLVQGTDARRTASPIAAPSTPARAPREVDAVWSTIGRLQIGSGRARRTPSTRRTRRGRRSPRGRGPRSTSSPRRCGIRRRRQRHAEQHAEPGGLGDRRVRTSAGVNP